MSRKRVLLAAVSDLHIGSTVALCPPEGIPLEDGGRYQPNPAQVWIWDQWLKFRDAIAAYKRKSAAWCSRSRTAWPGRSARSRLRCRPGRRMWRGYDDDQAQAPAHQS